MGQIGAGGALGGGGGYDLTRGQKLRKGEGVGR